ncbi:alpha/beta hydrolase [Streptococcus phocae subsp. phocae]|uniref:Acetyl esterase n=1 Tax=Streptococcus phocae TaxID=119224 RepID=A0A0P6SMR2_9STRE|nr:alpha/beta hydrolase family protein [Streptococcus phocae]KPJ22770.1 acetyl esterase [Streptococcus phocae]
MATITIEYHSQVLSMERQVNVIYPDQSELNTEDQGDQDIPVLYLLHGMGGNENSWQKRTNIERLLRHTNLIVVMPSTDLGWYTNTTYGLDYYTALAEELPQVLASFFPNMTTKRDKTFVAGLSMGGYGAFKWALKSNRFSRAASFSGALKLSPDATLFEDPNQLAYWQGIFGDLQSKNLSQHYLTSMVPECDGKTRFYAWCGYEDFLFEANETAVAELRALGLEIDYEKDHGKHEWYYWNQQLDRLLDWLPINYHKEERLS